MAGMHNRPIKQPVNANPFTWQPPVRPASATAVDDIIDSYATMSTGPSGSRSVNGDVASPRPQRKRKSAFARTPSPLPGLHLPEHRRRKASRTGPQPDPQSPSPAPLPVPLPAHLVPPYQVTGAQAVPQVPHALGHMPPLNVLPQAQPVYVPLPPHGFIHELPLFMEPHTFTPMYVTPNGMLRYYVFADGDGISQVALMGRVDQMQILYQDLACGFSAAAPQPFVPPPER